MVRQLGVLGNDTAPIFYWSPAPFQLRVALLRESDLMSRRSLFPLIWSSFLSSCSYLIFFPRVLKSILGRGSDLIPIQTDSNRGGKTCARQSNDKTHHLSWCTQLFQSSHKCQPSGSFSYLLFLVASCLLRAAKMRAGLYHLAILIQAFFFMVAP